jgi:putative membrane protein
VRQSTMTLVADNTTTPGPEGSKRPAGPIETEPDYRFTLANERTFLAWQRTSLGLLAAAVALVQLVPELAIPGARRLLGIGLAALAIFTSGMGLVRWRQADRAMRRGEPLPRHPTPGFLAVGLIVLGVLALGLVIGKAVTG